jgi:hypothetical protein
MTIDPDHSPAFLHCTATLLNLLPLTDVLFVLNMIYGYGERRWNDINRENGRTRRQTCPSANLSTTNPKWIDWGAKPGLRGDRPATNPLSYGTATLATTTRVTHVPCISGLMLRPLLHFTSQVICRAGTDVTNYSEITQRCYIMGGVIRFLTACKDDSIVSTVSKEAF